MVRKVNGISRYGYGYVLKNAGLFVLVKAIQTALELFDTHVLLENSERKYRMMVDTAPIPFQSLDTEGRLIDVNRHGWRHFAIVARRSSAPGSKTCYIRIRWSSLESVSHFSSHKDTLKRCSFTLKRRGGLIVDIGNK
ncbi:MAG: hypothetical protein ACLFR8_02610 [Alkalispirochaeta sp.]